MNTPMKGLRPEKDPHLRYVTIAEAVQRLGVHERTIRRWVKAEEEGQTRRKYHLRIWRNRHHDVLIAEADIDAIAHDLGEAAPTLQQQVSTLLQDVEALKEELAHQREELAILAASRGGSQGSLSREPSPLHGPMAQETPQERRGLPPGTIRLIDFAAAHQMSVHEIKKRFWQQEIDLTVYEREAHAMRNKQEWWITPTQQAALITFWHQQQTPFTVCSACPHTGPSEEAEAAS